MNTNLEQAVRELEMAGMHIRQAQKRLDSRDARKRADQIVKYLRSWIHCLREVAVQAGIEVEEVLATLD